LPYKLNGFKVHNITHPTYDVRTYYFSPDGFLYFPRSDGTNLKVKVDDIYGVLAAPPCTMFSIARTNAKIPRNLRQGMELVISCLHIIWGIQFNIKSDNQRKPPLKFWALENPKGLLEWFLGKPAFEFHPWEFGDGYSKRTCLWGHFNPPQKNPNKKLFDKKFDYLLREELEEIRSIGDIVYQNSKTRKSLRSITPPHFAQAFFEANHDKEMSRND